MRRHERARRKAQRSQARPARVVRVPIQPAAEDPLATPVLTILFDPWTTPDVPDDDGNPPPSEAA